MSHFTSEQLAQMRKVHQHFSKGWSTQETTRFLALALCGEAGELANFVKKEWRGDSVPLSDIENEIADIYIYLHHLSEALETSIDKCVTGKIEVLKARWPAHFEKQETANAA